MIERLKGIAAPQALVDAAASRKGLRGRASVHSAQPGEMSDTVVLLGPLLFEQGLRLPIAALLLPVGAHRVAPMVPDHSGGGGAQRPTSLVGTPANHPCPSEGE